MRPLAFGAAILLLLAASSAPVMGTPLTVGNPSFETPDVNFAGSFDSFPVGTPVWGFTQSSQQQVGAFDNTAPGSQDYIGNADGAQVAFMFVGPGISLFQDLSATYTPGQSYFFTIGAGGASSLPNDAQPRLTLYYRDPNNADPNTNRINIAQSTFNFDPNLDPGYINTLFDYTVGSLQVQVSDAWAGKQIGIEIETPGTPAFAYWDLDKARVESIPEPATLSLLGLGCVSTGFIRRRTRRAA